MESSSDNSIDDTDIQTCRTEGPGSPAVHPIAYPKQQRGTRRTYPEGTIRVLKLHPHYFSDLYM